jgi:hypothetical protein
VIDDVRFYTSLRSRVTFLCVPHAARPMTSKRKLSTKSKEEAAPAAKRAKSESKSGDSEQSKSEAPAGRRVKAEPRAASSDHSDAARSSLSSKDLDAVLPCDVVEIGDEIPPLGTLVKAAVMCLLNGNQRIPKFNKMSGIQEFKNAVALFVNIRGCSYENSWLSGGARITWFAQDRQTQDTPVIQRLINRESFTESA